MTTVSEIGVKSFKPSKDREEIPTLSIYRRWLRNGCIQKSLCQQSHQRD